MSELGRLVVNLSANIADFSRDMTRSAQVTEQTMGRMNAAADKVKNLLGAIGVAFSVGAIVSEANRAIGALADLDDMAQKTGSSVEMLSRLGKVASMTGADFGSVDGAIVKLAKNLAEIDEKGNKTAKALAAIGISVADIKGKDPAQVFVMISEKMQGYADGAGKVATVTDLMGKAAANNLPYMNDVAENINRFTGESAEAAAAATKFQDDLGALRVKYDEMSTAIISAALPAMNDFLGALGDTTRASKTLTGDTNVDGWADDIAVGLARVVDVAKLIPGIFEVISGSFRAVGADIDFLGKAAIAVMPANLAATVANGTIQKALAERNAIVGKFNDDLDELWNKPANETEQAMLKRIAGRKNTAGMSALGAMAGTGAITAGSRPELAYSAGGDKGAGKAGKPGAAEWSSEGAAARMGALATNEAAALRMTIEATDALAEADMRRFEQKMRADEQVTANAQNIRMSLMTDAEMEQLAFDTRIAQIQEFGATTLATVSETNALIEAETARHEKAKFDLRAATEQSIVSLVSGSATQLYGVLKQAGLEQTALGKAAFLAMKAMAVAQIIISTNVAAAAAMAPPPIGLGPVAGVGLAGTIKAMGYASAAMTAGLAIAEASAEGGYDIPGGVNPVTQLHEKEMVLPKAQAEVIRNLATNGGGRGNGASVTYSPQIHIDSRTDQGEVQRLVYTAVQNGNADLVDKLTRAGRI